VTQIEFARQTPTSQSPDQQAHISHTLVPQATTPQTLTHNSPAPQANAPQTPIPKIPDQQTVAPQSPIPQAPTLQNPTLQSEASQNSARTWTIKTALEWTQGHLTAKGDANPRLSAQWLLCAATGLSRLELYTNYEQVLVDEQLAVLRDGIKRRVAGEPLQYIVGTAPFRKLELVVRLGVLIPRPETEVLVDIIISELKKQDVQGFARILDVCTGTGNIALSLLHECPGVSVVTTDNDPIAVLLARENAELLGFWEGDDTCCERDSIIGKDADNRGCRSVISGASSDGNNEGYCCIDRREGSDSSKKGDHGDHGDHAGNSTGKARLRILEDDLASTLISDSDMHGYFDAVVSNPPYVPTSELGKLPKEVAGFEPVAALDGGADGLEVFRRIVGQARILLKPYGLLACELFETTLDEARDYCLSEGFTEVLIHYDLTNRPRIITARTPREVSL